MSARPKIGLLLPWILVACIAAWWSGSFARELTGDPASACHVLRSHTLRPAAPRPAIDPVAPCMLPGVAAGAPPEITLDAAAPSAAEFASPVRGAFHTHGYPRGPPANA